MAAALYRDDFFAGFHLADSSPFDEWRFFQAESLRRDMIGVLDCLVQNYSAHGDYGAAIAYARRWLALDPLHEPVHRWLMRLYSWLGRQSAALRQYDECVHILHTELHDQPERETTDLYITIKARQLTAPTAKVPVSSVTASSPVLVPPLPDTIASITAVQWEYPAFVGCLSELKHLHQALQQALRGQGQVVFVTGEAGRGKTALLREFASQAYAAAAELLTVVGFCNAQTGSGDSYLPFRQILRLLTGDIQSVWTRRILSPAHINRLLHSAPATVQCLIEHGPGLIDTMIARSGLMKHFSVNGNRTFSLGEPLSGAALGRNDLAEQYVAVMQALAHHQPLLIMVDELHWGDEASINLLFHLGRQVMNSPILLVGAFRQEEIKLGRRVPNLRATSDGGGPFYEEMRHPLAAVLNELRRDFGEITIDLSQAHDHHFVDALIDIQPNRLGSQFRATLYGHTQGHPLFTVELLRAMRERGELVQNEAGQWVESPLLIWDKMPAQVEAVIQERIDRLPPSLRQILTVASVEGETFTVQVIAQVLGIDERLLLTQLTQELEKRHHLVRKGPDIMLGSRMLNRFVFSHVLFQRHLYQQLSSGEQRLLHKAVAAALSESSGKQVEEIGQG